MRDQGKGDVRRPMAIDKETFAANWERNFGPPKKRRRESREPENTGGNPEPVENSRTA